MKNIKVNLSPLFPSLLSTLLFPPFLSPPLSLSLSSPSGHAHSIMTAAISQPSTIHLRMNLISQCYDTLREKGHFVHEGSSRTNFEAFWEQLNNGFSLTATRPYKPSNSSVEAFYRGTMSRSDFVAEVEEHIIKRAQDKLDANLDPLLTISWDVYSSKPDRKILCETINRLLGRQLWAMFNKLDTEGYGQVHINDITELVMKIFDANGQPQSPVHIAEWFCNQESVDFWSFFSALAEKHYHLLQIHIIQSLYEEVVHEILKQGKMVKKGHKVQTWKERWFILTSTNLIYYESLENRIQKVKNHSFYVLASFLSPPLFFYLLCFPFLSFFIVLAIDFGCTT